MSSRWKSYLPWLIAYLVILTGAIWGTCLWRNQTMVELNTPEEQQAWQEFRANIARDEVDGKSPVKHVISRRDEPPLLVWLRERFAVILVWVILFTTIFFGITMFLVRGLTSKNSLPYPYPAESQPPS